jgi:hypothetical protein
MACLPQVYLLKAGLSAESRQVHLFRPAKVLDKIRNLK